MSAQNVLKVDIFPDNLIFWVEGKNKRIEVRRSDKKPNTFVIVYDSGNVKTINISELGIPDSGDVFGFLLGLLNDPKLFELILQKDFEDIERIVLNADLENAQIWGIFDIMLLNSVLLRTGFRRVTDFSDRNVLEYVHQNGDALRIYYAKIIKNNVPLYLIYKLEGVLEMK